MVRHSEIVNGNARLKKEIDHLRKERTTANEVHAQFEASIHQIRGEISGLMAQASAINDHREELVKTKEVRGESRLAARRLESREGLLSDRRVAAKLSARCNLFPVVYPLASRSSPNQTLCANSRSSLTRKGR